MPFWKKRSRNSLDTWARAEFNNRKANAAPVFGPRNAQTAANRWQGNKARRIRDIYNNYQNTNPGLDTGPRLGRNARNTMLDNISALKTPGTVNIYGQGRDTSMTPSQIRDQNHHKYNKTTHTWQHEAPLGDQALNLFAYRINPPAPRGSSGRFTINTTQSEGLHLAQALEHEISNPQSFTTQSKMKGIDRLGQRTDDGIVYFDNTPSWNERRKMAKRIRNTVQTTDYTPQGMDRIKPGVSWAEGPQHVDPTKPAYSTSHGTAHSTIIEAAIRSTAKHYGPDATQDNFDSVYTYKLKRAGLNSNDPARRKNRSAPIKKPWESRWAYMKRRWG